MKGDAQVLSYLNRILTNELTAINQYYMHYKMCENWGFKKLAEVNRKESFEEMEHADALMERILFLEGLPNLQDLHKINVGETVQEQLKLDMDLEMRNLPLLREAVEYCREQKDEGSKALIQRILVAEEEHVDWLETQLELIDKVGAENYLQYQL